MNIAVLADWSEHETTIKAVKSGHSWAGLRSLVPDEAPVVGFDTDVPDLFCLAGQGGYGIMMAPELAKLTVDLCTNAPGVRTDLFGQALSPQRLL
jgi:D-arginine dehydrogenase